jgi:tetratricopeptide (TPR) repeat protein
VAAAGRSHAGTGFQEAVDNELAVLWAGASRQARELEGYEPTSGVLVRAALSATPYLLRLDKWQVALNLLEPVFVRDQSRATAEAMLPALQAIAAASAGTEDENASVNVLARALGVIDRAATARHSRASLAAALARQDYAEASIQAGSLTTSCLAEGRLGEALALAEDLTSYSRQADLGPWTQLLAELRRLQVLAAMGQAERVLTEVHQLLAHVDDIPTAPSKLEFAVAWNVHEALLNTGREAAVQLFRWQDALDLNAIIAASMLSRGASATDRAETVFNNYGPLLRLGHTDAALTLLLECREVFESAHDVNAMGAVLSGLADVEDKRGHGAVAIGLARDALRYMYLGGKVTDIAKAHHNLGILYRRARQQEAGLVHYVAAALIRAVTGSGGPEDSIRAGADDLRGLGDADPLPADLAELHRRVADVPGVDLDQLLTKLAPDRQAVQRTLEELTNRIRALASTQRAPYAPLLVAWEPVIAAMLAAKAGDTQADAVLNDWLADCERSENWSALARALRRLRAGQSGPELLHGLDNRDAVIVNRAQDALAGQITIPVALWAVGPPLRWLLALIVGAAIGADDAAPTARQRLDSLAADPQRTALARALRRILHGDRDPSLASELDDPTDRAVVATALHHIGTHDKEER